MKFRRSTKSDAGKHDSLKPVQISIPQKDAIAIEPPKRVIKALYDYNAPAEPAIYLSFSAGDFLHVVSRENDPDWYEACNPLAGTRGLVPVRFFDIIGKTVRDSGDSSQSGSATHDSGYAEGGPTSAPRGPAAARSSVLNGGSAPGAMSPPIMNMAMPGHRVSKSMSKGAGGVYGIVSYDFRAERPDELDAKEGEAIIVIAQSNPEWFVAKPITRLGGPGLIPVSFIEIRDMATGRAVDDPAAAVAQAGIPRVEEWKKMAAEYKNTSIPLGTVSSSQQAQSMQQGMERMSLQNGQQTPQAANGFGSHSRQPSSYTQGSQNAFVPERASVPRYIYADDKFHFVVECRLSDGTHWDLSRVYEDFYELQISLINAFPEEAGQVPGRPRILPYMPGPVKYVTDNISEGRRASLDEYLRDLLRLDRSITCCSLVRGFFSPREGDYEVDPTAADLENHARPADPKDRYSQVSQNSHHRQQPSQSGAYPGQAMRQSSNPQSLHQHSQSQASNSPYGHTRQMSSQTSVASSHQAQPQQLPSSHYRSASEFTTSSQLTASQQNQSSRQITAASSSTSVAGSVSNTANPNASTSSASTPPVKVKAWFDRDTCVVIRMPPRGSFTFDDLYRRVSERRRLEYKGQDQDDEDLHIEYRDEKDGEYYRLEGDEDLEIAVERNEKLTLAVRAAGS